MTQKQIEEKVMDDLLLNMRGNEPESYMACVKWAIQSAILAEREACAKAAISWTGDYREVDICHRAAEAIRARSNAPEVKCSRGVYGDYDTLPSLIPETEKEITAQTPPKSRQAGVFTANPAQTMDSEEKIAPDPVSA